MKLHPSRRAHEYGRPPGDFLPSEISYDGPDSDVHKQDYAAFVAAVAENTHPAFERAYRALSSNGYGLAVGDVPVEVREAFCRWVREYLSRQGGACSAPGLVGGGW